MRLRAFVVQSSVGPSSRITSTPVTPSSILGLAIVSSATTSSAVVKLPWTLARKLGPTGGRLIRHAPVLHPPAGRQPLDAAPLWADPLDRAARGASDLIPESCTGSGGRAARGGRGGGVFARHRRSDRTRRQRGAPAPAVPRVAAVDVLGRVDELASSVDAVTGAAIGPYRKFG